MENPNQKNATLKKALDEASKFDYPRGNNKLTPKVTPQINKATNIDATSKVN